jgi:hypothetical protein
MFVIIHYCLNRLSLKIFCNIAKWEEEDSSKTIKPKSATSLQSDQEY